MVKCGIPYNLKTINGSGFVSKFFADVCTTVEVSKITTTEYQPETNGEAERFDFTKIPRLRHYTSIQKTDWDTYLLSLVYTYIIQWHGFINVCPFRLAFTRNALDLP